MAEIFVGKITQLKVSQTETDGNVARVFRIAVPDLGDYVVHGNENVLDYERKQPVEFWIDRTKKLFQNGTASFATEDVPAITPCAGAISVITDTVTTKTYVAMAQKDAGAPRDAGFRVPRNGFPQSQFDWFNMGHLVRETFEEGIFISREHQDLLLSGNPEYDAIIQKTADNLVSHTGLKINGTKNTHMALASDSTYRLRDKLVIYGNEFGEENFFTEIDDVAISFTPETGFNVIKRLSVIHPIDDLLFVDGETFPNGKPIMRDYCLMLLDEIAGKKFGDQMQERVYRHNATPGQIAVFDRMDNFYTDKVPRAFLCQLVHNGAPIYPVEWMVESLEFLSRPSTLRSASTSIRYSEIEKKDVEKRKA